MESLLTKSRHTEGGCIPESQTPKERTPTTNISIVMKMPTTKYISKIKSNLDLQGILPPNRIDWY